MSFVSVSCIARTATNYYTLYMFVISESFPAAEVHFAPSGTSYSGNWSIYFLSYLLVYLMSLVDLDCTLISGGN
jgi:hypothetical protein